MSVYYNENDPKAAAWLRALIDAGELPSGEVDSRSILDVTAADVAGFSQCHFFAGIGGWPYALMLAGWPADAEVWTGSCPCQSFSCAGARRGFADERHLWPAWFKLIDERRPAHLFGEQVASPAALAWLDVVCDDLEGAGYATAAADLGAASVGAPHIRQRLWFVAYAERRHAELDARERNRSGAEVSTGTFRRPEGSSATDMRAHADEIRREQYAQRNGAAQSNSEESACRNDARRRSGVWGDAQWINCSDGKSRPIESGTAPLAHGLPARVVRLRGYGNAIVPQVAAQFIGAYMECLQ